MYPPSHNPTFGQNPSGNDNDVENVDRALRSLQLNTDGISRQIATSQDDNAFPSGRYIADHHNPPTFGENYSSNVQNHGQENHSYYRNWFSDSQSSNHGQENHSYYRNWFSDSQSSGAGTSTGPTPRNFVNHCPPEPNFVNTNPYLRPDQSFRPMGQYISLYSDNSQRNQDRSEALAEWRPRLDLNMMHTILISGNYQQKQSVINILKDDIFGLMRDKQKNFLFPCFLDACEDEQLNSIVGDVLSERDRFIDSAFCNQGSNSIVKLIGKLKKTNDHAFAMTRILSTRFLDIMTDSIARKLIKQCLNFFGTHVNKILHEKAIDHFKYLATHEVGCISLNDCINTISGEYKNTLLDKIAEVSDYLSNDPFGNFVVQNVLSLRDTRVTTKILMCLQGQFVYLSQKKGGSHVVEKCMESSDLALKIVVEEIVETPRAPLLLAQDQFGNYIIQKALKRTKIPGFSYLYCSLVKFLEPHCTELNRTKGGKNIIQLLQ